MAVAAPARAASEQSGQSAHAQSTRETVESIVVAVILAFLFRAFIAEAFVIPTGSMAPTLQGRHMDVECPECGYDYRTGASSENADSVNHREVTVTVCPLCRFPMKLDKAGNPNHRSFNGDRILVSKFAYALAEPRRWDVIVFKYPGNAKQNYIKRLIGLPGESVMIRHGDIFVRPVSQQEDGENGYRIARKPADKVRAMLQVVDDTRYRSVRLQEANWPSQWFSAGESDSPSWEDLGGERAFTVSPEAKDAWLRYRHIVPTREDWDALRAGQPPLREIRPMLITDYYEYNDNGGYDGYSPGSEGIYWVGDLALESWLEVQNNEGAILLDLVEGGRHYGCRIDIATGEAQLSIDGGQVTFSNDAGQQSSGPTALTGLRGPGRYRLRFANVDDQLFLWINNRVVRFDGPTTFSSPDNQRPRWSPTDPGDLAPVGIGSDGAALRVSRLRVLRDIYYVAVESDYGMRATEYELPRSMLFSLYDTLSDPTQWATTPLFDARRSVVFELGKDEFFPLGDNSPQSKDARLWSQGSRSTGYRDPPPHVQRELLIGKALLIYWPHAWRGPFGLPVIPNFARMGLIR